jgi:hypothetical protein
MRLFFIEGTLPCLSGQDATNQMAAIERTMLPFKKTDQFLRKALRSIGQFLLQGNDFGPLHQSGHLITV